MINIKKNVTQNEIKQINDEYIGDENGHLDIISVYIKDHKNAPESKNFGLSPPIMTSFNEESKIWC